MISFEISNFVRHLISHHVRIWVEGIRIETKSIEMVMMPPDPAAKVKAGGVIITR